MNAATKQEPPPDGRAKTLNQPPSDALATTNDPTGAFRTPERINERLAWAQQCAILISPAPICVAVPDGYYVSIAMVRFNVATDAHPIGGGKHSLLKHALFRLANAAGVCFDEEADRRLDDKTSSRYVFWHAAGAWRDLNGSILTVDGDAELDLRDGSAQVEKIYAEIKAKDADGRPRTAEQIEAIGRAKVRDMRAKIVRHAQTQAQLAAIRKHLLVRSYTGAELSLPFVIARLAYDGDDPDPEIKRDNKRAMRDQALGGARAMFGARGADAMARPLLPPPPIGEVITTDGEVQNFNEEEEEPEQERESEPGFRREEPRGAAPSPTPATGRGPREESRFQAPAASTPAHAATSRVGRVPRGRETSAEPTIRVGRAAGTTFSRASGSSLDWYARFLTSSIDDPKRIQWREDNKRELAALRAEQAKRRGRQEEVAAVGRGAPTPVYDDPYAGERDEDEANNPEKW